MIGSKVVATKTQLSVEQYLHSSFEGPDREFVDGRIVERRVGGTKHSVSQGKLVETFSELRKSHSLFAMPEIRLKLGERRFRIADVAVFRGGFPADEVPKTPLFIVVEIVSPDDRYQEVIEKLDEYRRWGVPNIWLVDPYLRKLSVYGETGLREVSELHLPELQIQLKLDDVV